MDELQCLKINMQSIKNHQAVKFGHTAQPDVNFLWLRLISGEREDKGKNKNCTNRELEPQNTQIHCNYYLYKYLHK